MAMMDKRGNTAPKRKPLGVFQFRSNKPTILNWKQVHPLALRAALGSSMAVGATVSFSPAQGGVGVTLRIYKGDNADVEYAGTPEQLVELLALVAEGFASESEDIWQAWAVEGESPTRPE